MGKLTYDPVFIPEELGRVMTEISSEELGITYRQKAFLKMIDLLDENN